MSNPGINGGFGAATEDTKANIHRKIAGIELKLADIKGWQDFVETNNNTQDGQVIVRYAENLAKLIQAETAAGKNFEDAAQEAINEVAYELPSAHMEFLAISALVQTWEHGKSLREWCHQNSVFDTELTNNGMGNGKPLEFIPTIGSDLPTALEGALALSQENGEQVVFKFNDVTAIPVTPDSTLETVRKYMETFRQERASNQRAPTAPAA